MNERIRQLLNEATVGLEPDLSPQRTVTLNEMEKFAELIVAECLAVCAVNTDDEPLDYKRGVIFAMNRCQRNIKEHFGVEE